MNIAVLLFGQPRHIELTYNYILEEFSDLPAKRIDFFGHFWNIVGYTPEDEDRDTQKHDTPFLKKIYKKDISKLLPFKELIVDDNRVIDELCLSWMKINKHCLDGILPIPDTIGQCRYYLAQHYSIRQAYSLLTNYEAKNDIKYDVVIKTRTDLIYKNKQCYENESSYKEQKRNTYCNIKLDIPAVYVNALRVNKFENKKWVGTPIQSFISSKQDGNKIFIKDNKVGSRCYNYTKFCKDFHYPRLCFNDWLIICNRLSSDYFFKDYFVTLFRIFNKDISTYLNDPTYKWEMRSEHAMQGNIVMFNNINVFRITPRRDIKVFNPERLKIDVETTSMFKCTEDLQQQLITKYKK